MRNQSKWAIAQGWRNLQTWPRMKTLPSRIRVRLSWRLANEAGATMVEFGLLVALVAVVVATAAATLGNGIAGTFDDVADGLARCAKFADKAVADPAQDNVGGWKCQQ